MTKILNDCPPTIFIKKNKMKISILTPTRNNVLTIKQTIDSVLMQDYCDVEYIVIDGYSEDGSGAVIESYRDKISKIIYRRSNSACEAMNFSLRQATGDIVGSVFGDDFFVDSSILSNVADCFLDKSVMCVYGDMIYVERENSKKIIRYWKSSTYKPGSFYWGWHPTWVATFYRKEVFEKYGFLTDKFKLACDYEFLLRTIHVNKVKTRYLPEVVVHMRAGGSSSRRLKNLLEGNMESCMSWGLNGLKMPLGFFIYKPLSKFYQYLIRP